MSDENAVGALSTQYECRVKLLAEILKLYVGFLLAFAIALFACLGALPDLVNDPAPAQAVGELLGVHPELPALHSVGQDLTAQILKGALLLSPFFILAWIAGFLFLRWNYDVVIKEMDRIAWMLAEEIDLPANKRKYLEHEHFLDAYAAPKRFLPAYAIIALPVLLAFVLLGLRMATAIASGELTGDPSEKLPIAYLWVLGAGLVICIIFDILYRRRIRLKLEGMVMKTERYSWVEIVTRPASVVAPALGIALTAAHRHYVLAVVAGVLLIVTFFLWLFPKIRREPGGSSSLRVSTWYLLILSFLMFAVLFWETWEKEVEEYGGWEFLGVAMVLVLGVFFLYAAIVKDLLLTQERWLKRCTDE